MPLKGDGVHKIFKYAGQVGALLPRALLPRGFLPEQDITWRRWFIDLACVRWEPCWGWECIEHLQEDCIDVVGGKAVVS